ncbi:hypothetical protein FA09DRAFT_267421 [Tilletiopsis washingtonensis]|uniref:Uncharacterized protein n=1 Tax=Tilletiopsis washingtonensis TaxID=58919 RepID=A0A316ZAA6_9BASI|nr:hypothetical protein FA09DRAFT_267421 [Tilletiopsis washingtonensis]PWN98511.1 hypothetical protein FA09DRAFT_267421 [Tilletiopsis washingtonensis]
MGTSPMQACRLLCSSELLFSASAGNAGGGPRSGEVRACVQGAEAWSCIAALGAAAHSNRAEQSEVQRQRRAASCALSLRAPLQTAPGAKRSKCRKVLRASALVISARPRASAGRARCRPASRVCALRRRSRSISRRRMRWRAHALSCCGCLRGSARGTQREGAPSPLSGACGGSYAPVSALRAYHLVPAQRAARPSASRRCCAPTQRWFVPTLLQSALPAVPSPKDTLLRWQRSPGRVAACLQESSCVLRQSGARGH